MSDTQTEQGANTPTSEAEGQDKPTSAYGRRALMLGAAAGVGVAASLVTGDRPAGAADGGPVLMAATNTCTFGPTVEASAGTGIYGISDTASGLQSGEGAGVIGDSDTFHGVIGLSSGALGVYGVSVGKSGIAPSFPAGVFGDSTTAIGVIGVSSGSGGVYGQTSSASANGVVGVSVAPSGDALLFARVVGDSDTNPGVYGVSSADNGVVGEQPRTTLVASTAPTSAPVVDSA